MTLGKPSGLSDLLYVNNLLPRAVWVKLGCVCVKYCLVLVPYKWFKMVAVIINIVIYIILLSSYVLSFHVLSSFLDSRKINYRDLKLVVGCADISFVS